MAQQNGTGARAQESPAQLSVLARLFRSCTDCAPWLASRGGPASALSSGRGAEEEEHKPGFSLLVDARKPPPSEPIHSNATQVAPRTAPESMATWRKKSLRILFSLNTQRYAHCPPLVPSVLRIRQLSASCLRQPGQGIPHKQRPLQAATCKQN